MMDIPKDKAFPADAGQCDMCGGHGCSYCDEKGWLPKGHSRTRYCRREKCYNVIPPTQEAVYCSNQCAFDDA